MGPVHEVGSGDEPGNSPSTVGAILISATIRQDNAWRVSPPSGFDWVGDDEIQQTASRQMDR